MSFTTGVGDDLARCIGVGDDPARCTAFLLCNIPKGCNYAKIRRMNLDAKALLNTPVENVRGVGRPRAGLLAKLGIRSASDLLFDFPRDYLDLSHEGPIVELDEGELQTVRGVVTEIAATSRGFGKSRVSILLQDPSGHLRATWFNQPFMRNKFHEGQSLLLTAKPKCGA